MIRRRLWARRAQPQDARPEDPQHVLCPPATFVPPVPAVIRPCGTCSAEVWVSLTMRAAVDAGLAPCCFACMDARVDGADIEPVQHPDQRAAGMTAERFAAISACVLTNLKEARRG